MILNATPTMGTQGPASVPKRRDGSRTREGIGYMFFLKKLIKTIDK